MKKTMKAVKIVGITLTAVAVALVAVYFFSQRTTAENNEYKAVTEEYVPATQATTAEVMTTVEATEVATEEATTVEATEATTEEATTVEATEATTEEVTTVEVTEAATEATTVAPTEVATETTTVAPTEAATVAPTEAQTEAATEVAKEPATQAPSVNVVVNAPVFTDIVYSNNGVKVTYKTVEEAKAAINVPTLTDAQAQTVAIANKAAYAAQVTDLLNKINAYRTANGLATLTLNDNLTVAAMHRAAESAYADWNVTAKENGVKRHIRPNFQKASSIKDVYGITGNFAENFGRFFDTTDGILEGWQNSSSHNALLLSANYSKVGLGVAADSNGDLYWIALFN